MSKAEKNCLHIQVDLSVRVLYFKITDPPIEIDRSATVEDLGYKELKISFNQWDIKNTWIYNAFPTISDSFM